MKVNLTPTEIMSAAHIGTMRQLQALNRDAKPRAGATNDNNWQIAIEGALAEAAVAKGLGMYWLGAGNVGDPDVGNLQVRSTQRPNGCLLLRDRDDEDEIFILVTGQNGRYRLVGWMYGDEAKSAKFLRDPKNGRPPLFFIPQNKLRPMKELKTGC